MFVQGMLKIHNLFTREFQCTLYAYTHTNTQIYICINVLLQEHFKNFVHTVASMYVHHDRLYYLLPGQKRPPKLCKSANICV